MASYTSSEEDPKPQRPRRVKNGPYRFEVIESNDEQSSNGNDMFELKLDITMPDGTPGPIVFDNLVFVSSAAWKIDDFRRSTGENVKKGEQVDMEADDQVGKTGWVRLKAEEYPKGSDDWKMKVDGYILPPKDADKLAPRKEAPAKAAASSAKSAPAEDDDIPF